MIPLEIVTLLGSTLLGGMMKMYAMKQKLEAQKHTQMMQALEARQKERTEIRSIEDKRFTWTRRFIAITVVLSVFVLPKLAAFSDLGVVYGWTEYNPGFLFFTDGKDELLWHQVSSSNIVITPLDTHAAMSIIGLYFGGSIAGHK
jgi:hypothetical protein